MGQWQKVAAVGDVPVGSAREFAAGGRVVALFNVDGTFYALDGICAHAGGPLGAGSLSGSTVTCPWHGWQFDVKTGRQAFNPLIGQQMFPVKVESDAVWVEIP